MLDLIRRKQKSTIIKIVFWTIIAAFVGTIFLVWGKGSDRGQDPTSTAVTINDQEVALDTFQRAYSNLYNLYQNLYREQFTPEMEKRLGLRQMALERVIDQALLAQEAEKRGIAVSKGEVIDSIAEIPSFQDNGVFSKERYLQVLNYQRITPDEFEASQRRQLMINKVIGEIQEDVQISAEDVADEYRRNNEEVNLNFVTFAGPLFEDRVEVAEDDLAAWFAEHQEEFRIPATVALRYLRFEPARYKDEITFTNEELERYYRRHLDQFEIPEQVEASHILIQVSSEADREKRRELAEKVLQEVQSGKDFADLARTYSDDQGTAKNGGSLGYFPRGVMVGPFEEAAFALKPGQVSDIVQSPFGFHIIKVTGHIEAGVKPLEDAIEEVKAGLREEKARQLAIEKAMDAYNLNRKSGDLDAAATANNLKVKETGFFSRGEAIEDIGQAPEVAESAFQLQSGQLAKPVVLPEGVFLFAVKERRESRLPELADVRPEVEEAYRRQQAVILAREAAEAFLQEVKQGAKFPDLAAKKSLKIEETGNFSRTFETFVPRIGNNEALAKAAFALSEKGEVAPEVYESGSKLVVAALKERKEADMAKLDQSTREQLRASLQAQKEQQKLDDALKAMRDSSVIEIAPALANLMER